MNDFINSSTLNVSKDMFKDENLAKYISILFYHHFSLYYHVVDDEFFLENEYKFLEIDKILSTVDLEEHVAIALSNRYLIGLFAISYYAASDAVYNPEEDNRKKQVEKETLKKLNDPSIINIFDAISSYSGKVDLKSKDKAKNRETNLIKHYNEQLKNLRLHISKLEDENEQLKQRIETGKKMWDDNKKLKEENEKLKLILKNLGVSEPPIG